jgi:hypothetical protein
VLFSRDDAYRAAWITMLVRSNLTVEDALALWDPALDHAVKDVGVMMMVTQEGAKFFTCAPKDLWKELLESRCASLVVPVGIFFLRVRDELEALVKVKKMKSRLGLREAEEEIEQLRLVH